LAEARQELSKSPTGHPLVFIAPRQATYQVERRILADRGIEGYTRLHVLSFERLAGFVFDLLKQARPQTITEDGRLMVLRALLARHREKLKVFRASARLAGFSAQLSSILEEFQRNQLTPTLLQEIAVKVRNVEGLDWKIQDLATILDLYNQWLREHELKDADSLLGGASEQLKRVPAILDLFDQASRIRIDAVWVDGFAEFSPQELEILVALAPFCGRATLTFCLDRLPQQKSSWLSTWSVIENAFFNCRKRFEELQGAVVAVEVLKREAPGRFEKNPVLRHLEAHWNEPMPFEEAGVQAKEGRANSIRIAACKNAEAETTIAAREILKHVRAGGRYRDVAVLARNLHKYHAPLHRTFTRYGIPFFLDRRESVTHHPAVELTRSALRTVALGWQNEDFFAALKTGLFPAEDEGIDRLENEALARGWQGTVWKEPEVAAQEPQVIRWLQPLLRRIIRPFQRLELSLAAAQHRPTGLQLAEALRQFWGELEIEQQLRQWSAGGFAARTFAMPASVHSTVWQGLNSLLENMELAFRDEPVSIREWLAILEAAFANFSVGVIPAALDQVLIGTVDRSRDPEIRIALILGLNETIFPALPETGTLLSQTDRAELERNNVLSSASIRLQISRERYYAYLACTRPRDRLILTFASQDAEGGILNPSPFLSHIQRLFPAVQIETAAAADGVEPEHVCELMGPLLKAGLLRESQQGQLKELLTLPGCAEIVQDLNRLQVNPADALSPDLAEQLYGPVLRTSISRIEQYAACPFKFFVHSGLRAQERKRFELDTREQGSFQHDALALFHAEIRRDGLRWRDLTPTQARRRIGQTARSLLLTYHDGLFQTSERSRFMGGILAGSLEDFVETLVEWMRDQYQFDPAAVELGFGDESGLPPYEIPLGNGHALAFKGRIDRVDLWRAPGDQEALCVVVDYKSSHKELDPVLLEHGLQLQLMTYLNVLRLLPDAEKVFGVKRLAPVGVFYVSLRGKHQRKETRDQALKEQADERKSAYQHTGRFDVRALSRLDARPNAAAGNQFAYRLTVDGVPWKNSREAMDSAAFRSLLDSVQLNLKQMGSEIFSGSAKVSPFRKGSLTACAHCDYRAICRVDPWTQEYRMLKRKEGSQ